MPIFETPFNTDISAARPYVSTKQVIPSSIKITHISLTKSPINGSHVTLLVSNGEVEELIALARLQAKTAPQVTTVQCSLALTKPTKIALFSDDKNAVVTISGVQYTDLTEEQIQLLIKH